MKLENQVQKFPGRTKIADFRKNAEDWKHCLIGRMFPIGAIQYLIVILNRDFVVATL